MQFRNLSNTRIQLVISTIAFGLLLFVLSQLIQRSIWLDEGMLLKSIVESKSWLNYLNPLPYYDQAQPALVSLFHHVLIHYISEEIVALRVGTLVISLLVSAPISYLIYREKIGLLIPTLLCLAFTFSIGFYFTELKHYAFEVAASFLILYFFYMYISARISYSASILFISATTLIGFSTLIPAFVSIAYLTINEITIKKYTFFNAKNMAAAVASALLALIAYIHMQHLTIFQLANFDVYLPKGILSDLIALILAAGAVHGLLLTIATAIIVILGLFSKRNSLYFKFTMLFVIIIMVVTVGKLSGHYPVTHRRHIVWLTPFSLVLITVGLAHLIKLETKIYSAAAILIFSLICLQCLNIVHKIVFDTADMQNNKLYHLISELPPSNVVIFPAAQPTLEYYMRLSQDLLKHNYIGLVDNRSGVKDLHAASDGFKKRIDSIFAAVPNGPFYYVVSHNPPLFSGNPPERHRERTEYVEGIIRNYNCSYHEIFSGKQVQLLKMHCNGVDYDY